ncbi:MAG: MFS transporter [Alteromonadales bacterium]|nr:MFS transporter [Alteromonadales bacterium]
MLFTKQSITYLLTCLFSGFSSAFISPLLSLYLIDELKVAPISMGLLISAMIFSGVAVSQFFAKKSDAGSVSRKKIILMGQVGFVISTLILALTRNYFIALTAVIFFMSFSACSLPQVFTMGRHYADNHLADKAVLLVTMMRASIAVAWVMAPPLAFLINDLYGFTYTFLIAGLCGIFVFIIVLSALPAVVIEVEEAKQQKVNWMKISGVFYFLLCIFFAFSANNMYITSISLYITQEVGLASQWVGYFMGIAALIEIPIMLSAGYLAVKFGANRLIFLACLSGLTFYLGLLVAEQIWQFIILQLFNGVFIGINASLGMVVMQDLMKKQMGLASTLFSNSQMLSILLSSLAVGLIAQYFSYYAVFTVALLFCLLALLFIYLTQKQLNKQPDYISESIA